MKKPEFFDKGHAILSDIPMDERINQWVWLLDKRIINRFSSPDEREAILHGLTCFRCGTRCEGHCGES